MAFIILLWFTLMIAPPAANLLSRKVNAWPGIKKKVSIYLLSICLALILGLITGFSFTLDFADDLIICSTYFAFAYLLILAFKAGKTYVKVLIGIIMFPVFTLGYFLCTLGIWGLIMIGNDLDAQRTFNFSGQAIVKQHNLGFATSEYRGVQLVFFKTYKWLPIIEHEIFKKQYDIWGNPNKAQVLDGYNFNVDYDTIKHAVIIYDKTHRYNVNIP